jgi:quercetin dioxygenase-like cupin family protein
LAYTFRRTNTYVTDGIGYYQEKSKPIQLIQKGEEVNIPHGIEHWHAASHDNEFTPIAINPNTKRNCGMIGKRNE